MKEKEISKNDLVIKLMKEKKKSEMQMAALLGKTPATIYRITKKENTPTETYYTQRTLDLVHRAVLAKRA